MKTFNVQEFGATGRKADDARPGIQKAVDACAAAGGGMVSLPPGEYTSGMIHLRSRVRFHLEAGATLCSSKSRADYDVAEDWRVALLFGEDLQNVSIEGRGTIDGQAEYEWKAEEFDDRSIKENLDELSKSGKPPLRAFPKKDSYGGLVLLLRCTDVRIEGVSFLRSPSWTINPYGCKRLVIDGIYIHASQKEGVWADGIDPDGCSDLRISNCTIETGDDALAFSSSSSWGPALPCENITVSNCRLSSSSSAIKFSDANSLCVRNVVIDNCVVTSSNRGIAFMTFDGGYVSDVVISNCIVDCRRFDWFWWGDGDPLYFMSRKRYSELHPELDREDAPAGSIRNILLQNIVAHGQGRCLLRGHPERWLEGIRMDNVRLFLSADAKADYNKEGSGLHFRFARDVELHHVQVVLGEPSTPKWKSALAFEDSTDILVEGFRGSLSRGSREPAISLKNSQGVTVRNSRVDPANATLLAAGVGTKDIVVGTGVIPPAREVEQEAIPGEISAPSRRTITRPKARPVARPAARAKARPAARPKAAARPKTKAAAKPKTRPAVKRAAKSVKAKKRGKA